MSYSRKFLYFCLVVSQVIYTLGLLSMLFYVDERKRERERERERERDSFIFLIKLFSWWMKYSECSVRVSISPITVLFSFDTIMYYWNKYSNRRKIIFFFLLFIQRHHMKVSKSLIGSEMILVVTTSRDYSSIISSQHYFLM